jgi:hypothetical protein
MSTSAYSIAEFCRAHRVSKALVYLLLKRGDGPAIMKVGRRTLISAEAAEEWRRRMENARPAHQPTRQGRLA